MEQSQSLQDLLEEKEEKLSIHVILENRALMKLYNAQSLGGEKDHLRCIGDRFK